MKTHVETVHTRNSIAVLCLVGLSLSLAGCGIEGWLGSSKPLEASVDEEKSAGKDKADATAKKPETPKASSHGPAKPGAPARPVSELLDEIEVALSDSATTSRTDPNRNSVKRKAALRRQIGSGVSAADELIAASPNDPEALASAWRSKLTLLYRAALENVEEFDGQLASAAEAVTASEHTEVAEYGNGLVLGVEYLDSDKPIHEVAEKLTEHARTYPDGKSSVRLFLAYAKKLAKDNRPLDANSLCQAALWELHDHDELPYIQQFLKKLGEGETRKAETRKRDIVQKIIENQVAHLRASLPLQIDELTILYEVEADYRMVIYKYRVAVDLNEFRQEQRTIEEGVSRTARGGAVTRKMLDKGIRLKYMYFGKDGTPFHDFIVTKR
ncbi:MAG: hypothetical protein H8E37_14535 [Planctomycetes bacterium]|nr:hypothetical protein [Planctomycetota bacterium]